jgi:hypothetical protein
MTMDSNGTAMVMHAGGALEMTTTVEAAIARLEALQAFVAKVMHEGLDRDYATLPGTNRKTLLKPGAEKLCELYGLVARYEVQRHEDWLAPFFMYHTTCRLFRGERCVGEASASCNSRESKYAGRWVSEAEVPEYLDKATLRRKKGGRWVFGSELSDRNMSGEGLETRQRTSRNGKPYTQWRLVDVVHFVPNQEIADCVNTLEKMAAKRALVSATIAVTRSADLFVPDMDDVADNEEAAAPAKRAATAAPDAEFWEEPEAKPEPATAAEWSSLFDAAKTPNELKALGKRANGVKVDDREKMEASYKANVARLTPAPKGAT